MNPGSDAIAGELGDLPLALHLAGSYLRTYHAEVTQGGYLTELRRSEVVQHASLLGAGLDDSPSPTRHVQNVAQTFALWLDRLDREREVDRIAIALLARMACMAPGEPVPHELLARTLDEVEPLQRADGLRRLVAVGLVEEGEGWLRLHRLLVYFVRQEGLDPEAQPAVERILVECGKAAADRRLSGRTLSAVIPHLIDIASRDADHEPRLAGIYCATGQALHHAGDLHAAQPWLELALETRERALGSDHPETADSLTSLAELLVTQGRLTDARSLCERVVAVRERVQGIDHPDTAESLNNLARVLHVQGELAPAKTLFERAHTIFERVMGPDHPSTATSINNLGLLMWNQGDRAVAERLLRRALDIRERVLGADHPDTATALNNLALVLRDRGDLETAKAMTERALSIIERTLGPSHTNTASALHNLARLLWAQGDVVAARPLFERALAIRESVLRPGHSATVTIRRELAELAAEGGGPAAGS